MKRLKFFWPYLSQKNSQFGRGDQTPFHFVAHHGLSDIADFMLEELQEDSQFDFLKNVRIKNRAQN